MTLRHITFLLIGLLVAAAAVIIVLHFHATANERTRADEPFIYPFTTPGVLLESDESAHSASEYWWLNSGAKLIITEEYGETIQGPLNPLDPWRLEYALDNPVDTEAGFHPQNLYRLVSRKHWGDVRTECFYYIVGDNESLSPNRNGSNGLFLMSRYSPGGQTLYYAGIRVDGQAVIKKKYRGEYSTLAETTLFPGEYSRGKKPDLLPHQEWLGLRMETKTDGDIVIIRLYVQAEDGTWQMVLEAIDTTTGSEKPIFQSGPVGIRTDFMDVRFRDFRAETLQ